MARNKEFDYTEKLESARNLFWEQGYHATSMHDLVDKMQLNRSSIYDTYGNKHELFMLCLLNYATLKIKQYRTASGPESSPFNMLEKTIKEIVNQTLTDDKACLIVKSIFELAPVDTEVKQAIRTNGQVLESIFLELLTAAKEKGEIRSNTSPEVMARYILSGFSSFWSHYILTGSRKEVNEMVDFLLLSLKG